MSFEEAELRAGKAIQDLYARHLKRQEYVQEEGKRLRTASQPKDATEAENLQKRKAKHEKDMAEVAENYIRLQALFAYVQAAKQEHERLRGEVSRLENELNTVVNTKSRAERREHRESGGPRLCDLMDDYTERFTLPYWQDPRNPLYGTYRPPFVETS